MLSFFFYSFFKDFTLKVRMRYGNKCVQIDIRIIFILILVGIFFQFQINKWFLSF